MIEGLKTIELIRIGADWSEFALKKIDDVAKELKALEIIIEEYDLREQFNCSYEEFLSRFGYDEAEFPKDKYDLLKGVINNDYIDIQSNVKGE